MDLINLPFIFQLFVLLNPLSSFSVLLEGYKRGLDVKKIAFNATIIAFLLAVVIIFSGPFLFSVYGISIDSFRIAGGIILLLLGIETVRGEDEETNQKDLTTVDSLSSIIATPLLTGPAVISFLTLKIYEMNQILVLINSIISFFIAGLVFFLFAVYIKKINLTLVLILSKVLGLFLTAVAIEMIAKGISALLF
jgi:multiple antibiotic resistance protein